MKIAFHAPMKPPSDPVPSGERRMAQLFVAALTQAGFAVEIASDFRSYEGKGDAERQRALAAEGQAEARRLVERYRTLRPAERPALWFTYHLYHKAPDHLGPAVARALGLPYVVAEASHAPKQRNGRWAAGFEAAQGAIAAADRIYGINPVDRACLEPVAKPNALRDLAPFIDTAPFRADRPARPQGLGGEAPRLLTVAMMRRDQKLDSYRVLADALARLEDRRWSLALVGSGPAEAEVRRFMAPFGTRIVFRGRLDGADLAAAYAGADLFVWPSVKEAVGLSFIEAAASGCALVAGRSGGIDAIVDEGRTGFVVPAGDAQALADRLAVLLDDPASVARMGAAGAGRARRVNDIAGAAAVLGDDLRDLIGDRCRTS